MEAIIVNTDRILSKAEALRQTILQMNSILEEMQHIEAGLGGTWTGESRETFRERFEVDVKRIRERLGNIEEMVSCQEKAAGEYLDCEERAANLIGSVT